MLLKVIIIYLLSLILKQENVRSLLSVFTTPCSDEWLHNVLPTHDHKLLYLFYSFEVQRLVFLQTSE